MYIGFLSTPTGSTGIREEYGAKISVMFLMDRESHMLVLRSSSLLCECNVTDEWPLHDPMPMRSNAHVIQCPCDPMPMRSNAHAIQRPCDPVIMRSDCELMSCGPYIRRSTLPMRSTRRMCVAMCRPAFFEFGGKQAPCPCRNSLEQIKCLGEGLHCHAEIVWGGLTEVHEFVKLLLEGRPGR